MCDWLKRADALPGLDVERLKGLMLHGRYRRYALPVLENNKLVRPRDLRAALAAGARPACR